MAYKRFEDTPVWQKAVELYLLTEELLANSGFKATGAFRNQLDRAALSVSNNIAEGFERGTTPDRINFLYIAKGSAGEVRSMLALKLSTASPSPLADQLQTLKDCAESCARQLGAWAEQLQNSDIKGQRHLTEHSRDQYQKAKAREAGVKSWNETIMKYTTDLPDDHPLKLQARSKGQIP